MSCYKSETIHYSKHLFSNVDMTYVIHLEGNGRLKSIKKELDKYRPSRNCTIVFNKGFKKCSKPHLPKQLSPYDLVDANLYIINDAKKNNYKQILILEDDFFFEEDLLRNPGHVHEIEDFLNKNSNDSTIYYLGCLPLIVLPSLTHHNKIIYRIGTHSVIYNEKAIEKIASVDQMKVKDWDHYLQFSNSSYMYYRPLCFQLFEKTENSNHWGEFNPIVRFTCTIFYKFLCLLRLDVQTSPGYPFFYTISKIVFLILFLCLVFIIQKIGRRSFIKF